MGMGFGDFGGGIQNDLDYGHDTAWHGALASDNTKGDLDLGKQIPERGLRTSSYGGRCFLSRDIQR